MNNTLFYINLLKENDDKVNNVNKLIKKYPFIQVLSSIHWKKKLKIEKIFRMSGLKVTKKKYKLKNGKLSKKNWVISELAIWATYLNVFYKILETEDKYKYFIIFEDDVILRKQFMLLLYKYYINNNIIDEKGGIRLGRNLVGSIFTRNQIKRILNFVKKYGIFKAIDDQLIEHNYLKKYNIKLVDYNRKIKSERKKTIELNKFIK